MATELDQALAFISSKTSIKPQIALVLGSGLGEFAETLSKSQTVLTSEIPHYPHSTVQGHEGKLVFGRVSLSSEESLPLVIFKGRVHYYESGDLNSALFPIRIAHGLGARYLIVTNAAGGINHTFNAGDLMLIRDYINLTFLKIISQRNSHGSDIEFRHERGGTNAFDKRLQGIIREAAKVIKIPLKEGTYCWLSGPTYETLAEIEMLRRMGVDATGMSTVPEIVLAQQLDMKIGGISLISNMAAGMTGEKLSHQEVMETANRIKVSFTELMRKILVSIKD